MIRWRWVTLVGILLGGYAGCSGKAERRGGQPEPAAGGETTLGTGGSATAGEGGSAGENVEAGRGGTVSSGKGGSTGAAGGTGGAAGVAAASGAGALGGSAGAGMMGGGAGTTNGGSAGTEAVWKCRAMAYGDGETCDCGCGVPDPDCDGSGVESCDVCSQLGGCAFVACPSNIARDDNTRCEVPVGWVCGTLSYGDGFCDCGCGVLDSDCNGKSSTFCLSCPFGGCSRNFCETVDPSDNTVCTAAPYSWKCPEGFYRDGTCDCGCGFFDPDCDARDITACERCNAEGSCSGQACPGLIAANAIEKCEQPPAPPEWRCEALDYGDGSYCNCGCGVQDPDCRDNVPERCDYCDCGACPESVALDDPTQCAPAPPSWICPPEWYGDDFCDCGCGAYDHQCTLNELQCERCEGCAHGDCGRISELDRSRCTFDVPGDWHCATELFYDDVCDCGCGTLDADCLSANKAECSFCDSEGSCSDVDCEDPESTIVPDDNTRCAE